MIVRGLPWPQRASSGAVEGKFQIRGLPPGEYLAVAIDYVEDGMWNDPDYLESIRRYGHEVTLGESDAQTVARKFVTP